MRELISAPILHTCEDFEHIARVTKGAILAAPLRHPAKAWESWARRRGTGFAVPIEQWLPAWMNMDKMDKERQIFFVPLDTLHRVEAVRRLGEVLNIDLEPDFDFLHGHVEDNKLHGREEAPEMDLSPIFELDFVKRFYGNLRI